MHFASFRRLLARRLARRIPELAVLPRAEAHALIEGFALDFLHLHGLRTAFALKHMDDAARTRAIEKNPIAPTAPIPEAMIAFYCRRASEGTHPHRDILELAVEA